VPGLKASFSFVSNTIGTYKLVVDTDKDGKFDPAAGDVLVAGQTIIGTNLVDWDGNDNAGLAVPPGTYDVRLSLRVGEFHFVGHDIETANPGLRILEIDPPVPGTTPQPATMFWDDTLINDKALKISPAATGTSGLSSGTFAAAPVCSKPGATGSTPTAGATSPPIRPRAREMSDTSTPGCFTTRYRRTPRPACRTPRATRTTTD